MMTTASGGGPAVTVGARRRDVVSRAPRAMKALERAWEGRSRRQARARVGGSLAVEVGTAQIAVEVIELPRASSAEQGEGEGEEGGRRERKRRRRIGIVDEKGAALGGDELAGGVEVEQAKASEAGVV